MMEGKEKTHKINKPSVSCHLCIQIEGEPGTIFRCAESERFISFGQEM